MRGLWEKKGVPQRGWSLVESTDLGEPIATCEMCDNERVRFIHVMRHPDHKGDLGVGCVCAEKMTDDYVGPRLREAKMRNRASRRLRWLTRTWRVSSKGNDYLNVDGINVTVYPIRQGSRHGRWGYKINDKFSSRSFLSEDDAKLAAFDELF